MCGPLDNKVEGRWGPKMDSAFPVGGWRAGSCS